MRLCLGCVLLSTLCAQVVLAEHRDDSETADEESPPMVLEAAQAKPRYAGWLLHAYLLPTAVGVSALTVESGALLIASGALMWLVPSAVHFFAGEYRLAARGALVLAFAAAGALGGGVTGYAIGSLLPSSSDEPDYFRTLSLFVGAFGGGLLGVLAWAIIDLRDAFVRDAERRVYAASSQRHVAFSVVPTPQGVAASLMGTF